MAENQPGQGESLTGGAGVRRNIEEDAKPQTGAKPSPAPAVKPPTVGPKGGAGNSGAAK